MPWILETSSPSPHFASSKFWKVLSAMLLVMLVIVAYYGEFLITLSCNRGGSVEESGDFENQERWTIMDKQDNSWPASAFPSSSKFSCDDQQLKEYAFNDTVAMQEILFAHQNPANCSAAKFYIMLSIWNLGFGSSLHVRADQLLKALSVGRVFIQMAVDGPWDFAPTSCYAANHDCYFLPVTKTITYKEGGKWDG